MYINEESYKKHLQNYIGEETSRRTLYNWDIADGLLTPESDLTEYEAQQQWETFNRLLDELEEERAEREYARQKNMLQRMYDAPQYSPLMHWNEKYKTAAFENMTPLICINDLVDWKYAISAVPDEKVSEELKDIPIPCFLERGKLVVEYASLDEMVRDGWRVGS